MSNRTNDSSLGAWVLAGVIFVAGGLFVAMGGSFQDVKNCAASPAYCFRQAGLSFTSSPSGGFSMPSFSGGGGGGGGSIFTAPARTVSSGAQALGGGIAGAMGGMAR
jgi:hypothetical protein